MRWSDPIAEDITYLSHRTWRNQTSSHLGTSTLLANYDGAVREK